jgi:hypothetical protein
MESAAEELVVPASGQRLRRHDNWNACFAATPTIPSVPHGAAAGRTQPVDADRYKVIINVALALPAPDISLQNAAATTTPTASVASTS